MEDTRAAGVKEVCGIVPEVKAVPALCGGGAAREACEDP